MDQPVQAQGAQPQGQADPKMMEAYQRLCLAAMKIIYDPKVAQGLVQTMKTAGDPAAGVAHVATVILGHLRQQAQGIPPAMVNAVAPAVVAMLFDLGHAAKLFQVDQGMIQKAVELVKQTMQQGQPAPQAAQQAPQQGIIANAMPAPAMVQ